MASSIIPIGGNHGEGPHRLKEDSGVWKVCNCMVYFGDGPMRFLQSGEEYRSEDSAVSEMKRRAVKCLAGMGCPETEGEVEWEIRGDNWPLLLTESEKEGIRLALPKGK